MKFQDSSFNGLKVTVGTKSVTHPRTHAPTHAPKAICPINFFKVGGIIIFLFVVTAAGVVPCGICKKRPRTSSIVQFIFYFWSFEIS